VGDRYNCEIVKACLIQICFKIKIDINIVIDIYINYQNQASSLTPNSPEYFQNLAQQYPVGQRLAALYRQNALAEQKFNNQNQRSLTFLNQLVPLYNQLQNLGVNTAPQLTACQNGIQSLQGAIPYGKQLINQLGGQYQKQVGLCLKLLSQCEGAGVSPLMAPQLQNAQNIANNLYLAVPSNLAPYTANDFQNMLNVQLQRLPNIQNALVALQG